MNKKCKVLIPDTILMSSGVISNWYFSSSKSGEVLRKRPEKLQLLEAAVTLIKQAVTMALANGGVKAVSHYWKQEQNQEEVVSAESRLTMPPLQAFDNGMKDPDIDA